MRASEVDVDHPAGLSTDEARARLATHGPNRLEDRESQGLAATLRGIAGEPMFLLLIVAAGIYLALGDLGEGLLLACFAAVTMALVIWQERRSARALDALRDLSAPQARAWRDGAIVRLAAADLVPGDLVLLSEGERVPADGVALAASTLAVDESLLTGESVPVRKAAADADLAAAAAEAGRAGMTREGGARGVTMSASGGDDLPWLYAGTLVVSGHGLARVVATGARTHVGGIGASLARIEPAPTPLQRHLRRLVRVFGVVSFVASGVLLAWHGLHRGDWLGGVLSAIALGMSMLPEEFPMTFAVFMALGTWRLARVQVLARRPAAVEALVCCPANEWHFNGLKRG